MTYNKMVISGNFKLFSSSIKKLNCTIPPAAENQLETTFTSHFTHQKLIGVLGVGQPVGVVAMAIRLVITTTFY